MVGSLLTQNPDLTLPPGKHSEVRHITVHHIRTIPGPRVTCRPQQLVPDRLTIAKTEFDAMLRDGTAHHSDSSWCTAIHIVPKKHNHWRPCGYYRALNTRTIPDAYTIRHIHDYSHQLFGCSVFSKIHLVRAYEQIPVYPDDIQNITITTPFCLLEFPSAYPSACSTQLCFAYLNDILIFSRSLEEHERHLQAHFDCLRGHGILINPAKCVFRAPEITFLGYKVSAGVSNL
jgi:hypothetical protein